jgi:serine phosphatase RsbU (regulator of sigma subunit)
MKPRRRTPRELVEALQERADGAREHLWALAREPLMRLMTELIARHQLNDDRDRLTVHALHLAETWVRTRPAREFHRLSWDAFRNAVVLHVARQALQPFGGQTSRTVGPAPLPDCTIYHNETLFLPYERLGGFWFGGDWFGGHKTADGALWVIVADVTGHGYFAYLLASVLPNVWDACWKQAAANVEPAGLLKAMHSLLETCLPDGVYAECTLVRLSSEGEATVSPAGGTRLLLRRKGGSADLLKLRGGWLGLFPPSAADQKSWTLAEGDELLLGTDGAFDHLTEANGGGLPDRLGRPASASLLDEVQRLLGQALNKGPQQDDITLVLLRRRVGTTPTAAAGNSSLRKGAGNVSV